MTVARFAEADRLARKVEVKKQEAVRMAGT